MVQQLMERLNIGILFGTCLALFVPWVLFQLGQQLHKFGDPPWKKRGK